MAISPVTVTFSLYDFLGYVPDVRRTKVILTTNVGSGWIADTTTGGGFRLSDAAVTIDAAGLASFSVLPSGATGLNPAEYQIRVQIDAANPATRQREKVDLGWYTITAAANLKDLAAEQYVPPTYLSAVTTLLDTKVTAAETARAGAEAAEASAQALVLSDLGTTDGQTRALIENPASQTAGALSASIDARVPAASTTAQGKVELATTAETVTGTDAVRAVTPAGLTAGVQNLADTRGGIVVLASKYGAVGDNSTDNSTAIANALADIKAAAAFAKAATLKFDAGTFLTSTRPTLDAANLVLRGDGRDATKIKLSTVTAGSNGLVEVTSGANGCRIEHLTLDANGKINFALHGDTASDLRLTGVKLTGSTSHGAYLSTCADARLDDVLFTACGTGGSAAGIFTSSCDNLMFRGCSATNNYQHGYYLLGGAEDSLVMTGCYASGNGGAGFSPRYTRMTLTGCIGWGNGTGGLNANYPIEPSTKGSKATLTGCIFGGSTGTVANEASINGIDQAAVTGCYIESALATSAVLLLNNLNDATVTGNTFVMTGTTATGGLRFTNVTGYLAAANTIIGGGTGGNGIYIATSSTGLVTMNRIKGWSTGITLSASVSNDVHVLNNMLEGNTTRVSNSSTGTGCIASGNERDAGYWTVGQLLALNGYTIATLPAANGSSAGTVGFVTDAGAGRLAWSNGSSTWQYAADRIIGSNVIDFASIAAGTTVDSAAFTVTGARIADAVILSTSDGAGAASPLESGLMGSAFVSGNNSVKVRLANVTTGAIDPASRTYHVTVVR